jgi:hypothetical protein
MMRGDGEETWNNGPGSFSRRPSGRKSARQIPAGTPHPASRNLHDRSQSCIRVDAFVLIARA